MRSFFKYTITLVIIVITANIIYVYSGLYKKDIHTCDGELIYKLDSLSVTNNILYFAESSNFTTAVGDSSTKSISELLNRNIGHGNIFAINKSASHAGVYKKLIYRLKNKKTKILILTMNLRSFGINWIESKLETNLSKTNIIYSNYPPILKKFMLSFKAYDHKELFQRERIIKSHYKNDILFSEKNKFPTIKKWDAFMFDKGHILANGQRDAQKCELACHFIKNFAFNISEDNPRVNDFDDIVDFCEQNNIKIILNLLAENFEKAKELCGDDLVFLMNKNIAFLKNRYDSKCIFVDNSALLKDSNFIDRFWPTEHYNYEGRKRIAENIASAIRKNNLVK